MPKCLPGKKYLRQPAMKEMSLKRIQARGDARVLINVQLLDQRQCGNSGSAQWGPAPAHNQREWLSGTNPWAIQVTFCL